MELNKHQIISIIKYVIKDDEYYKVDAFRILINDIQKGYLNVNNLNNIIGIDYIKMIRKYDFYYINNNHHLPFYLFSLYKSELNECLHQIRDEKIKVMYEH